MLLSTPRDEKPGQCNFFYNDEMMSHLHGYMLLVGLFVASDPTFVVVLTVVGVLATILAGATELGNLPTNPRVPAVVAMMTLAVTCFCRYGISFETFAGVLNYESPTESARYFEMLVCVLNVAWGFGGSWRIKEPIDGATFGF